MTVQDDGYRASLLHSILDARKITYPYIVLSVLGQSFFDNLPGALPKLCFGPSSLGGFRALHQDNPTDNQDHTEPHRQAQWLAIAKAA